MDRDNDARTTIQATRHRASRRRRRRDDDDVGASSTTAVVRCPGGRTRRRRRRLPSRRPSPLLLPSLFLSFYPTARVLGAPYVVTWSGGKEDRFFCGTSYEDASIGCPTRQNCRSGRDDECLPFVDRDGNSIPTICYADTACDSMDGGGKSFVGDVPDGSAAATTNSTVAPTLAPVRPLFSNDPADHKFCGKTWNDANGRCHLNCRTMLECGELGEVCFDTSNCDARTAHPSTSQMPTPSPTTSYAPTATITTAAPTATSTKALTDVQLGFFCGNSWSDVTSSCRKRCPSGEDPECPGDETCFAFTGCPEERGYGEDPSGWVPGFDQFGDPIAVTDADSFADGVEGGDGSGADGVPCKGVLEIAITPDNWPKEISWDVVDPDGTEVLSSSSPALPSNASNATSLSSGLVAGETTTVTHCVNPIVGCRVFTIRDDGGDGLCCDHGEGGYEVRYQGELIKSGSTFYDSESVEFGCGGEEGDGEEGETTPTQKPGSGENPFSIPSQTTPAPSDASEEDTSSVSSLPDPSDGDGGVVVEGGGDGRSSHRCASRESVEGGYQVPVEDCDILTDCYNQYIETGDDWFCTEDEVCVVADECGVVASEASSVIDGSEGGADGTRPAASPARPTSGVASSASVPESMPPGEVAPPSKEPTNGPTSSLALTPYPTITSSSTGSPTEMATSSLPSYFPSSWVDITTTDQLLQVDDETQFVKDKPLGKGKVTCPKYQPCEQSDVTEPTEGQDVENADPDSPDLAVITAAPTPTPSEAGVQVSQGVENVDPDSPDLAVITAAPTPTPSEAGVQVSIASVDSTAETNEYSCTGEPCEVESWCRSRYGSCGPGVIYCNTNSIWEISCPTVSSTQQGFYCGTNWEHAVTSCNRPCPSGEDPECPVGQTCFADTGCKDKIKYDQFGNIIEEEEMGDEPESEAGVSTGSGITTETPTPSPWRDPGTQNDAIPQSVTAAPTAPALPPLPKPTLPTITNGSNVMATFSVQSPAAHSGTLNASAFDGEEGPLGGGDSLTASDSHLEGYEVDVEGKELTQRNDSAKSAEATYTDESISQWLDFTTVKSDGAHTLGRSRLLTRIILLTSSFLLLPH